MVYTYTVVLAGKSPNIRCIYTVLADPKNKANDHHCLCSFPFLCTVACSPIGLDTTQHSCIHHSAVTVTLITPHCPPFFIQCVLPVFYQLPPSLHTVTSYPYHSTLPSLSCSICLTSKPLHFTLHSCIHSFCCNSNPHHSTLHSLPHSIYLTSKPLHSTLHSCIHSFCCNSNPHHSTLPSLPQSMCLTSKPLHSTLHSCIHSFCCNSNPHHSTLHSLPHSM